MKFVGIGVVALLVGLFLWFMQVSIGMKVEEDPSFRFTYIDNTEAIERIRTLDEETVFDDLFGSDESEAFDQMYQLGYIRSVRYVLNMVSTTEGEFTGVHAPDRLVINTDEDVEHHNIMMAMDILIMILSDYEKIEYKRVNIEIIGNMGVLFEVSNASLTDAYTWLSPIINDESLTRDEKVVQMAEVWVKNTGYVGLTSSFGRLYGPTPDGHPITNARFERDNLYYVYKRYDDEYNVPRFKPKYTLYRIIRKEDKIEMNYSPKFSDVNVNYELKDDYSINFPAKDVLTGLTAMVDYYANYVSVRDDYPEQINFMTLEVKNDVADENHIDELYFIPMSVFESIVVDVTSERDYFDLAEIIQNEYLGDKEEVYFTKYLIQ